MCVIEANRSAAAGRYESKADDMSSMWAPPVDYLLVTYTR